LTVPVTFTFAKAGQVRLQVPAGLDQQVKAEAPKPEASHH